MRGRSIRYQVSVPFGEVRLQDASPYQDQGAQAGVAEIVRDTGCEQPDLALDGKLTETAPGIGDLAAQHQAFHAKMDQRPRLLVPGEGPAWGDLGSAFPNGHASDQDAILKPPKPEIIPAARILQLAAEHDTERDHEAAD